MPMFRRANQFNFSDSKSGLLINVHEGLKLTNNGELKLLVLRMNHLISCCGTGKRFKMVISSIELSNVGATFYSTNTKTNRRHLKNILTYVHI